MAGPLKRLQRRFRRWRQSRVRVQDLVTLSDDPLVLLTIGVDGYERLHRGLRRHDAWFFVRRNWYQDDPGRLARERRRIERHLRRAPGHRFVFLCNTAAEYTLHREAGLDALLFNQNAFVDERVFTIDPGVEKRFDAIYDAQLNPFKRHALAARVPRLALISYIYAPQFSRTYADEVRAALPQATWINDPLGPDWRWLAPAEVARRLNQGRVGLALSAKEGQMFACVQYMLCGLPVVSTPSLGGRDAFFDPRFTRVVRADAEAVAEAVAAFVEAPPDPELVRAETMRRVREHRGRLIDRIQAVYDEVGAGRSYAERWDDFFFSRMMGPADLRETLRRIERGEVPVPRPPYSPGPW